MCTMTGPSICTDNGHDPGGIRNPDPTPFSVDLNIITVSSPGGGFSIGLAVDRHGIHPYGAIAYGAAFSVATVTVSRSTVSTGKTMTATICLNSLCASQTFAGGTGTSVGVGAGLPIGGSVEFRWTYTCDFRGCHR